MFKKINTKNTKPQKLRIFNSNDYDLDCRFTLNSNKAIVNLEIVYNADQNDSYGIKSIIFCNQYIEGNSTTNILLLNLEKGNTNKSYNISFGDDYYKKEIELKKGNLIFVKINEYDKPNEELVKCEDIDIDSLDLNPKSRNGSILIGMP